MQEARRSWKQQKSVINEKKKTKQLQKAEYKLWSCLNEVLTIAGSQLP